MKIEAISYKYEVGVTLYLVPETDVERVLLRSLWAHGRLESINGDYAITTRQNLEATPDRTDRDAVPAVAPDACGS